MHQHVYGLGSCVLQDEDQSTYIHIPKHLSSSAVHWCVQRVRKLLTPAPDWGPSQPEDRKRYLVSRGLVDPEAVVTLNQKPSPIFKPSSLEQMSLTKSKVWVSREGRETSTVKISVRQNIFHPPLLCPGSPSPSELLLHLLILVIASMPLDLHPADRVHLKVN